MFLLKVIKRLRLTIIIAALAGVVLPYLQTSTSVRSGDFAKELNYKQATDAILPRDGYQTKLVLGGIIPKMIAGGIIDRQKLQQYYDRQGGLPAGMMAMMDQPSSQPLKVDSDNASWLLNLLWPIGLSNRMIINKQSLIAGPYLNYFASTGGWLLGKENNGGAYFNKYNLIPLTIAQEQRVRIIAETIYRPCCDNSTFFQDCNHGSAALALIELGVSQGLSDSQIYRTVLQFNSFWFPHEYSILAVYFKQIQNLNWDNVNPKTVLSYQYSSLSGNQDTESKIKSLLPSGSLTMYFSDKRVPCAQ